MRALIMENRDIRIGADEIILWLRKNGIANNIPNDGVSGLGIKIYKLIVEELNGVKIEDSVHTLWDDNDRNVHEYCLPKSSAQYMINTTMLRSLYLQICKW